MMVIISCWWRFFFNRIPCIMFIPQPHLYQNSIFYFQYVTEKMGGAEGTKLDHDFMDMETVK